MGWELPGGFNLEESTEWSGLHRCQPGVSVIDIYAGWAISLVL